MIDPDAAGLDHQRVPGDDPIPEVVSDLAAGSTIELVWCNEAGGLTFRFDDTFVKWNPRHSGIDLERERQRLAWLAGRHPVPHVRTFGSCTAAQWLVTDALPGGHAIGETWRARPLDAIRAIAKGLRAIHSIAIDDFPPEWIAQTWVGRTPAVLGVPPSVVDPVLVHGDACAPNTLITDAGHWSGNVDFGDLGAGDRWADLAVASLSLDWNFGEGHQNDLFEAYGIEPDHKRISYYRDLWRLES